MLLTVACSHNTFSPPSSTLPIATARTLGQDKVSLSGGAASLSEILGVDAAAAYLQASSGVAERTDLSIRATRAEVGSRSVAGTSPVAVAGRLGFKHNPGTAQRWFAVFGGAGAGKSAAGRFVSADVGLAASLENCYLIPTFAVRVFGSKHLNPRPVDTSTETPGTHVDTPKPSRGYDTGVGAELPLGGCGSQAPLALRASVGTMVLDDGETQLELMHAAVGAIVRF